MSRTNMCAYAHTHTRIRVCVHSIRVYAHMRIYDPKCRRQSKNEVPGALVFAVMNNPTKKIFLKKIFFSDFSDLSFF